MIKLKIINPEWSSRTLLPSQRAVVLKQYLAGKQNTHVSAAFVNRLNAHFGAYDDNQKEALSIETKATGSGTKYSIEFPKKPQAKDATRQ